MSTAIIKNEPSSLQQVERDKLEIRVALNSNLHGMPDEQVWAYYRWMAERVEVDPMSHPFDIITTTPRNGSPIKKLYPNSNLTAQLGEKRGYSYSEMRIGINKELVELGFKIAHVAVTVTAPDGRSLVSEAFVDLMSGWEGKALAGENLVNALKKAGTQCRRRGTLQMAGLALPSDEIPTVKLGAIERAEGDVDAVVIERPPAAALSAARFAVEPFDSPERNERVRVEAHESDHLEATLLPDVKKGDSGKLGAKTPLGKQITALKETLQMSDAEFLKLILEEFELEAQSVFEGADEITEPEQKLLIETLKDRLSK